MPLEIGNLRTTDKDVLTSPGLGFFLLDLEFHNIRRVLYDFGDVSIVARSDFAQDTLINQDNTTDKPIPLPVILSMPNLTKDSDDQDLTQNTQIVLNEQNGGRSGWIMQNIPWSCQLMKKTMNKW